MRNSSAASFHHRVEKMGSQLIGLRPSPRLYTRDFHQRVPVLFMFCLFVWGKAEEVGVFQLKIPELFLDGFVKIFNFSSSVLLNHRFASWVCKVNA